jgi:hypothetical protein
MYVRLLNQMGSQISPKFPEGYEPSRGELRGCEALGGKALSENNDRLGAQAGTLSRWLAEPYTRLLESPPDARQLAS